MGEKLGFGLSFAVDTISCMLFFTGRIVGNFERGKRGALIPVVTNPIYVDVMRDVEKEIEKQIKEQQPKQRACGFTGEWN